MSNSMTQKEVFERIYNIVLERGSESAIAAIDAMYGCYMKNNDSRTVEAKNITYIRGEFIDVIKGAQNYRDDLNYRGPAEVDIRFFEKQRIPSELLVPDLDAVENKNTIFYNKKVVMTGVFSRYPVRGNLALALRGLGADINTTISKHTEIVCLGGNGVGPAKMAKVAELKANDVDIVLVKEDELYHILDSL